MSTTTARESEAASAAKTPVGVGVIGVVGPILALLAVAAGVVLGHDALVWTGLIDPPAWTSSLAASVNGQTAGPWALVIGIVAIVVGVWLFVVGLTRRPRTSIALDTHTGVFLRPTDVARLARARAEQVDGVLGARAAANRRAVTVTVETTPSATGIDTAVQQAVGERLAALQAPPSLRVRTKPVAR